MKTIGLLGGMSWLSTIPYYRVINQVVNQHLGGLHSARLVLYNVDFTEIELLQRANAWNEIGHKLGIGARILRESGAELVVLCSGTMHKVSTMITDIGGVPLLNMVDVTADEIKSAGLQKIGLLGTRYTMEQEFYRGRFQQSHGLDVLVPDDDDRFRLHKMIYEELCYGRISDELRMQCHRIVHDLVKRGAQGIVFGCTEMSAFIGCEKLPVPLFDAVTIHAQRAAKWALDSLDVLSVHRYKKAF